TTATASTPRFSAFPAFATFPASTAEVPPPDPAQVTQAIRDRQAAQLRLDQTRNSVHAAQDDLDAARRLALAAGRMREDAAATCASTIRDASHAGIRNRHWWSWEGLKERAGTVWHVAVGVAKITVAVLGVVALVIGGPVAWVVLAAALVVLADTLLKYGRGETGLWDVGFALLDCIPGTRGLTTVGGLARGLRGAGQALREGRALTGILRGGAALAHGAVDAGRARLAAMATNLRGARAYTSTILRGIPDLFPSPTLAMAGVGDVPGGTGARILRADARAARDAARGWTPPVHSLENPHTLRFSQEWVSSQTRDGIEYHDLVKSMRTGGWKGDPIDIVELPDGSLLSIDNRRVLAAREAGLQEIPTVRHHPDEPFPIKRGKAISFKPEHNIHQLSDGTLVRGGTEGRILHRRNDEPSTWGEAALFRTARQPNNPDGSPFPLLGRLEPPRIETKG
ncbi:ParB/Srx family N-terminal domain-containing protein, partial [Frankia sp. Cppng1_Ct_nod]|uniref:ParB/Srx family N-terminal domain-containing protein n=1 Tax=Frankia sp. Cppng1_Ct_nod TaxID=2897162 RepID=UPI002023F64C